MIIQLFEIRFIENWNQCSIPILFSLDNTYVTKHYNVESKCKKLY